MYLVKKICFIYPNRQTMSTTNSPLTLRRDIHTWEGEIHGAVFFCGEEA